MADLNHNDGGLKIPRHVAIIMDGNGRWAEARGKQRVFGHTHGADAVLRITEAAARRGISVLTLFAFSSENWNRPKLEVTALMKLFAKTIKIQGPNLLKNNVKTEVTGDVSRFSPALQKEIRELEALTSSCTGLKLNIAANYGGRWDIAQAARSLAQKCADGLMKPEAVTEEAISKELAVPQDVDLLIRTGSEQRISNFLIWQAAYAELYFSPTLWPDYDEKDLDEALDFYAHRERRFGLTSAQLKGQD